MVKSIIDRSVEFIEQVHIPDLVAIAKFYKGLALRGGLSGKSVLSWRHSREGQRLFRFNLLLPGAPSSTATCPRSMKWTSRIPSRSRNTSPTPGTSTRRDQGPASLRRVTEPNFVLGPNTRGQNQHQGTGRRRQVLLDQGAAVARQRHGSGPLARYIIGYAQNNPEFKEPVDALLKELGAPVTALFSTLGRTAARGLECQWAAHKMSHFFDKLMANLKAGDLNTANIDKWEPSTWPKEAREPVSPRRPRRSRPLDQDQGHQDRQLPGASCRPPGMAAPRPEGADRRLRGLAHGYPGGQGRRAPGNPAHPPLLRPLPGLLDPRDESRRSGDVLGQGSLTRSRKGSDHALNRTCWRPNATANRCVRSTCMKPGAALALGECGLHPGACGDRILHWFALPTVPGEAAENFLLGYIRFTHPPPPTSLPSAWSEGPTGRWWATITPSRSSACRSPTPSGGEVFFELRWYLFLEKYPRSTWAIIPWPSS